MQPLITTLFTLLLLPITTALLPALLLSIIILVDAGCETTGFAGVGAFFTGFFFCVGVVGFFSQGHLFARAASQLSRRVFTTFKESVSLWFACNRLSIRLARLSMIVIVISSCSDCSDVGVDLQPANIASAVATGNARRVKIHLLDEFVVISFSFCSLN